MMIPSDANVNGHMHHLLPSLTFSGMRTPYMDSMISEMMSPETFRACGERLYGRRWQKPLADRLDVDRTTIWRYANGHRRIPVTTILAMANLEKEKGLLDEREGVVR